MFYLATNTQFNSLLAAAETAVVAHFNETDTQVILGHAYIAGAGTPFNGEYQKGDVIMMRLDDGCSMTYHKKA